MECPICHEKLADDAPKYWLVKEAGDAPHADASLDPSPVCKSCAKQMVGKHSTQGKTVIGFKIGVNKPEPGGLILKS